MPIRRRQIPQPRHNPDAPKALHPNILLHLPHIPHGVQQVDPRNTDKAVRERARELRYVLVREHRLPGAIPRAEADLGDACGVHEGDELGGRAPLGEEGCVCVGLLEEAADLWDALLCLWLACLLGFLEADV